MVSRWSAVSNRGNGKPVYPSGPSTGYEPTPPVTDGRKPSACLPVQIQFPHPRVKRGGSLRAEPSSALQVLCLCLLPALRFHPGSGSATSSDRCEQRSSRPSAIVATTSDRRDHQRSSRPPAIVASSDRCDHQRSSQPSVIVATTSNRRDHQEPSTVGLPSVYRRRQASNSSRRIL